MEDIVYISLKFDNFLKFDIFLKIDTFVKSDFSIKLYLYFKMSKKCTTTLMTIYKILILSIVLIPVISAFSLPTSLQEFLENENIVQGDPHGYLQNIRFKRQNEEEIEGSGSAPEYDILPDSEYDIVESSGEEEIIGEQFRISSCIILEIMRNLNAKMS